MKPSDIFKIGNLNPNFSRIAMKPKRNCIYLLVLALSFFIVSVSAANALIRINAGGGEYTNSNGNLWATDVVNRYLNALAAGDVGTIENLLSPELLKKRQRLLRNPSYPDFLRKWYATARFEIFGFQKLGNNRIMAEITVLQTNGESTRFGIILIKNRAEQGRPATYLIQSENVQLQQLK